MGLDLITDFIESLQIITTNNTVANAHNLQISSGHFSALVLMSSLDGGWLPHHQNEDAMLNKCISK
jgi:hypothetical protein